MRKLGYVIWMVFQHVAPKFVCTEKEARIVCRSIFKLKVFFLKNVCVKFVLDWQIGQIWQINRKLETVLIFQQISKRKANCYRVFWSVSVNVWLLCSSSSIV